MQINQIICTSAGANTGIADCALTLKNIVGGFLVPNSFELTAADLATPQSIMTALMDAVNADNVSERIFPLPEVVGVTDSTEDPVTETLGYGVPQIVRDGQYNLLMRYTKGGNCVSNALSKFNNGNYRYLGFDASGILFGTKVGTSLKGIPLHYFYNRPFRFNDGTNTANFSYQIVFNPEYINSGLGFVQMNISELGSINGLQNVNLNFVSRALGVIKLTASSGCGGSVEDFYNLFSTELASDSLWRATQNGLEITITSVAVDANIKGWTVTLDTTDTDYQAGQPVTLSLAPVSVLSAAGVVGYESLKVTTTT